MAFRDTTWREGNTSPSALKRNWSKFRASLAVISLSILGLQSAQAIEPLQELAPSRATAEYSVDPLDGYVIRAKEPEWQTLPYSYTFGVDGDITTDVEPNQDTITTQSNPPVFNASVGMSPNNAPLVELPANQALHAPVINHHTLETFHDAARVVMTLDTEHDQTYPPLLTPTEPPKEEQTLYEPVIFRLGRPASEGEASPPDCGKHDEEELIICVDMEAANHRVHLGDLPAIAEYSGKDFTRIISPSADAANEIRSLIISHGRADKTGFEVVIGPIKGCNEDCERKVQLTRSTN